MRTIYRDSDFKCHVSNDGTMKPVETDFFDGKCTAFVEGYRYVDFGESWTMEDGTVFDSGRMITSWKPYNELEAAQRQYERQLLAEYESALAESVRLSDLDAAYQEGVNAAYDR